MSELRKYRGPETFRLLLDSWDVAKAFDLMEAGELEFEESRIGIENAEKMKWMIYCNREHLKTMTEDDLAWPILVATWQDSTLIIDGWHRVFKALELGMTDLPCYVLSDVSEVYHRGS